ncbi:hypothetical protein HMSSN036_40260 [Paenibacillus macerans]|nr:hypothetical protein HMSSN036_40260 [Paenibacillus macerans]
MELGEDGVLFKKDTVKINLEGGNIQVEASEDLLVTVGNELKLISQKEESEGGIVIRANRQPYSQDP